MDNKRIDSIIRFFIYLIVAWLPFGSSVVEAAVVFALMFWLIKRFQLFVLNDNKTILSFIKSFRPRQTPVDFFIGAFLIAAIISVINSVYFGDSLSALITKTLEWFVIFYLVIEVLTEKEHFIFAAKLFIVSALVVCVDSILQFYIFKKDIFLGREFINNRATGPFKYPNMLAGYLTIFIPFIFSVSLIQFKKIQYKVLTGLIFFLSVFVSYLTFSRAGLIAIFVGIMLVTAILYKKSLMIMLSVLLLAISFSLYFSFSPAQRIYHRMSSESLSVAFSWRLDLWDDTLKMIAHKPLTGHGINSYMRTMKKYRRLQYTNNIWGPSYAHNCFLQIMAETGFFGITSFMCLIVFYFKAAVLMIKSMVSKDKVFYVMTVGLAVGLFAFIVHSCFDTHFYTIQLAAYFWLFAGLLMAFVVYDQKSRSGEIS